MVKEVGVDGSFGRILNSIVPEAGLAASGAMASAVNHLQRQPWDSGEISTADKTTH
jgi:hypothetical protein